MPYKIVKSGDKWLVKKADDSKTFGTHDSHDKATRQLAALHIHEKDK